MFFNSSQSTNSSDNTKKAEELDEKKTPKNQTKAQLTIAELEERGKAVAAKCTVTLRSIFSKHFNRTIYDEIRLGSSGHKIKDRFSFLKVTFEKGSDGYGLHFHGPGFSYVSSKDCHEMKNEIHGVFKKNKLILVTVTSNYFITLADQKESYIDDAMLKVLEEAICSNQKALFDIIMKYCNKLDTNAQPMPVYGEPIMMISDNRKTEDEQTNTHKKSNFK